MRETDCKTIEKQIVPFIRDELDKRSQRIFLEHIEECDACKEELSIQYLITVGMQRLENGDTFDLNKELQTRITTQTNHLQFLRSLQKFLYIEELAALLAAAVIIMLVVV